MDQHNGNITTSEQNRQKQEQASSSSTYPSSKTSSTIKTQPTISYVNKQNQPHDEYTSKRTIASTPNRYQLSFPTSLEHILAPIDDAIISICQIRVDGLVYIFSVIITSITAIEVALPISATLYAIGYDAAAALVASCVLTLALISQLPKKFLHRSRPWVVSRARAIRTDTTSSFPSRAVVCAVVFGWLAHHVVYGFDYQGNSLLLQLDANSISPILIWLSIVVGSFLSAFARINVGAHYPSDTICGFFLGCFIVKVGVWLESSWASRCINTTNALVKDVNYVPISSWWNVIKLTSYRDFIPATILSYLLAIISMQGFWVKCGYVYGMLLSAIVFRFTYICPTIVSSSRVGIFLDSSPSRSIRTNVLISLYFILLTVFGMATRRRKGNIQIVAFTIIFFGCLFGMIGMRMRA